MILGTSSHAPTPWFELAIATSGLIGAAVAVLSFLTGVKRDPKQALLEHAEQDTKQFTALNGKVDMLVEHFLGPKESL